MGVTLLRGPRWYYNLRKDKRPSVPLPAGVTFSRTPREYLNEKDGAPLVWFGPATYRAGGDLMVAGNPPHDVTLTRGFFLAKFEVTWAQFRKFCDETNTCCWSSPVPGGA